MRSAWNFLKNGDMGQSEHSGGRGGKGNGESFDFAGRVGGATVDHLLAAEEQDAAVMEQDGGMIVPRLGEGDGQGFPGTAGGIVEFERSRR